MAHPSQPDTLNLVVIGDQTSNLSVLLSSLLRDAPRSTVRDAFIRDAGATLRAQVSSLLSIQRERLPPFQSVYDLARIYDENTGTCHPCISSTLLCVVQLLQIFRYFEDGRRPENDADITVAGLCSGSLVAAAYAASSTLEDLKLLAIPTVSMAFQMGIHTATASAMLQQQTDGEFRSWSIAVPKMTNTEALSAIQSFETATNSSSIHRQCFLSAVGLGSVTISGTPRALTRFSQHLLAETPSRRVIWLPIFAAYHASHIHTTFDFSTFLAQSRVDADWLSSFRATKILLSPVTGRPVESESALQLFRTAVQDTLQQPLRLDLIAEYCASQEKSLSTVRIDVVAPAPVADSLAASFRARSTADVSTHEFVPLDLDVDPRPSGSASRPALAIVGMSGRFPGAESAEALWDVLAAGLDLHREIPKDRFNVQNHVDPTGKAKNTSWTPYGCFIDRPGDFDPRFFNMSPREALQTCAMQRLALVTAYEALEMAGFVPDRTRSSTMTRVGTFYGQTSDDYRDINAAQDIGTYFITGGIRAFGPGRINYFFKFGGPSYSVDTACSSSLAAIQLACTAVWSGDCDTAVAGGLSVLSSPDLYSGLSRGQFLSQTGSCKTFDQAADGYCRADGVGTVIIKRLEDAQMDRDNILGVILGAGTNHSAHAVSITRPHAEAQSTLYREILAQAGVDPLEVGYIEMHGTGTQAGDSTEMKSVVDVFAPDRGRHIRGEGNPLYVGAAKASIGHGEASSGVASLVKSLLVLQQGAIPPHIGIKNQINQSFPDLKARNVVIPAKKTAFPRIQGKKRTILVNNFSAAGGNTALLLQEPPTPTIQQGINHRAIHPVTVSGHTSSALRNNLDRLIAFLAANPHVPPADLSYTTTARRKHYAFRATVADSSIQRIQAALEHKRSSLSSSPSVPPTPRPVIFVFTGQGAAYLALGRELYLTCTQFRADINAFDAMAQRQGSPPFVPLVDGSAMDISQFSAVRLQTGLICVQMALTRLWRSWGIEPSAVIGHSLGEYAALYASGALSVSDTIHLVASRAQLLERACEPKSHSMLAVAEGAAALLSAIPDDIVSAVEIACVNSPRETVFAGPNAAIERLEEYITTTSRRLRCTKLQVPYAFHSAQVEPILDDLEAVARNVDVNPPRIPIISSLAGRVLGRSGGDCIDAKYIRDHCRQPVQFSNALQDAKAVGLVDDSTVFIEIGPHPVCSAMVKATLGDTMHTVPTLRRQESPWKVIANSLASLHDVGFTVNWSDYYRYFDEGCRLLTLPAYAFDNKNHWIEYRNDWTLRKGDPLPAVGEKTVVEAAPEPVRISGSVHRAVEERYEGPDAVAVFETDLSGPEIYTAISGHRVNGSALCPSSLYADIALTIANHIQQNPQSGFTLSGYNVTDMEIHQPLIIKPTIAEETRLLRIEADIDRPTTSLKLTYISITEQETSTKHATCTVQFGSPEKWLAGWKRDSHLIQGKITSLEKLAARGDISQIATRLAYRLFSVLVDYAPAFQRMDQILFDSDEFEASTKVKLDERGDDKTFKYSPYWLDALLHVSGFVINANDTLDPNEAVYISHGWETLRVTGEFKATGQYQTYVRMVPSDKTMMAGNVWIMCDGEVVALAEGLRFQRVPRAVLDMLLPPVGRQAVRPKQVAAPPKSKQLPLPSPPLSPRSNGIPGGRAVPMEVHQGHPVHPHSQRGSFLEVIADEIGVEASEVSLHDTLSDLGVDSLMSLSLAGKLLERFAVNLSHSHLMDCSCIGELLDTLDQLSAVQPQQQHTGFDSQFTTTTANSIRETRRDLGCHSSDSSDTSVASSEITTPDDTRGGDTAELVRSVILSETGILAQDLGPNADLCGLGVDSLMSLVVLGRLREEGLELPSNFFLEHKTMNQVLQAISGNHQDQAIQALVNSCPPPVHPDNHHHNHHGTTPHKAKVILLQKRSNPSATHNLFLFPDGSGSPSAYAALGQLSPDFNVYGLVCPFVNCPEEYTVGIEATAALYLSAIRNIQPQGPYHLGGWSVGGVLAYEASRQLLLSSHSSSSGTEVALLLLIDAPCPVMFPEMSTSLVKYLDSAGLFNQLDDTNTPATQTQTAERKEKLLLHFDSTLRNLAMYKPATIAPSVSAPRTVIILWAREGVRRQIGDAHAGFPVSSRTDEWMLHDRTDFGAQGWDVVLPQSRIETVPVDGNHFTMMTGENVLGMSRELQERIDRVLHD